MWQYINDKNIVIKLKLLSHGTQGDITMHPQCYIMTQVLKKNAFSLFDKQCFW